MSNHPKSEKYIKYVTENMMRPDRLYMLEEICGEMQLSPGMRVLDMGCGKGLTSIFLAKEYGVNVFAVDLELNPTENFRRFQEAGVDDRVVPIRAEVRKLPFAEEFFDAVVAVDNYHFIGTDEIYFPMIFSKLVKKGGQFGIASPGLSNEFVGGIPKDLRLFWHNEMFIFHTAAWWKRLWEKTELADITCCRRIDGVREYWAPGGDWFKASFNLDDIEFMDVDLEKYFTLFVMTAVKR